MAVHGTESGVRHKHCGEGLFGSRNRNCEVSSSFIREKLGKQVGVVVSEKPTELNTEYFELETQDNYQLALLITYMS